ncbi:cip1-interacting zinc finger protein-like [Tautogolabrus adspersus]
MVVSDKTEGQEKMQDEEDKQTRAPAAETGMEFLVPKTAFFCKVCNRFFSRTKEAEINHCKTLKHYENLQKFLQSRKMVDDATKRDTS